MQLIQADIFQTLRPDYTFPKVFAVLNPNLTDSAPNAYKCTQSIVRSQKFHPILSTFDFLCDKYRFHWQSVIVSKLLEKIGMFLSNW